jgi:hypothetical protein
MAETIKNASDRPVMFVVLSRDPLRREILQAQILGLHGLYRGWDNGQLVRLSFCIFVLPNPYLVGLVILSLI